MELSPPLWAITYSVHSSTAKDDVEVLASVAQGDREALGMLFRRYHTTVYRFTRQMTGSHEAAEDLTQDVFVALGDQADRFDPRRGTLTTYLYGIARHQVYRWHRRNKGRAEIDLEAVRGDPALQTSADPTSAMSSAQMHRELRAAIYRLPLRYREAVVLCELHGMSYEQAAAVVGCPVGTVRSRLSRGRELLIERCRSVFNAPPSQRATSSGGGRRTRQSLLRST